MLYIFSYIYCPMVAAGRLKFIRGPYLAAGRSLETPAKAYMLLENVFVNVF